MDDYVEQNLMNAGLKLYSLIMRQSNFQLGCMWLPVLSHRE